MPDYRQFVLDIAEGRIEAPEGIKRRVQVLLDEERRELDDMYEEALIRIGAQVAEQSEFENQIPEWKGF